jgi:hypothetical protein
MVLDLVRSEAGHRDVRATDTTPGFVALVLTEQRREVSKNWSDLRRARGNSAQRPVRITRLADASLARPAASHAALCGAAHLPRTSV